MCYFPNPKPPQLVGFVLVRNTWEPLRHHYSQFFDWVGIYSLEVSWPVIIMVLLAEGVGGGGGQHPFPYSDCAPRTLIAYHPPVSQFDFCAFSVQIKEMVPQIDRSGRVLAALIRCILCDKTTVEHGKMGDCLFPLHLPPPPPPHTHIQYFLTGTLIIQSGIKVPCNVLV